MSRSIVRRTADIRPDETEGEKGSQNIREGIRMKHLWLRIDSNSRYTDIAILSQNYQEPMTLNTGPTVKRNAEVIGRNCRPTVLWPAIYMFRLKIGLLQQFKAKPMDTNNFISC